MKLRLLVGIVGMLMLANIADAAPFAYVLNRGSSQVAGSVTVINAGTYPGTVAGTVPITGVPYSIAVSPKGGRVYVANQGTSASATDQSIMIIDADLLTAVTPANGLINYTPGGMALNKAETRLYVADQTNSRVHVYDLNGNDLAPVGYLDVSEAGTLTLPEGIALDETPAAPRLYVVKSNTDKVAAFDLTLVEDAAKKNDNSANLPDVIMPTGSKPVGIAIAQGNVYVSCPWNNTVEKFNSAAPGTTTTSIPVGTKPFGLSANAAGTKVYVANNGSNIGRVTIISTADDSTTTVSANTPLNGYAYTAAETAKGDQYLVSNVPVLEYAATDFSDVSDVNIAASTVTPITVGVNPGQIGMGPMLDRTLTITKTGTGLIAPIRTPGEAVNTIKTVAGGYKTFTLTPQAPNNMVSSVSVVGATSGTVSYGSPQVFTVGPITEDLTINVAFGTGTKFLLTANITGGGYCTLTSSPAGISVVPPAGSGAAEFTSGQQVDVTATAATGSEFKGWVGCDSLPSANVCRVTMNAAKTIAADCGTMPAVSDFLRGTKYYDSFALAYADSGNPDSTIKALYNPTKSAAAIDIDGVQSIKLDGGWDHYGTKTKLPLTHSMLAVGSLTISTTGTVELSEITIK